MKHKNLTLMAVAMSIVLSLSACGTAGKADSVAGTESVAAESTESVENSTEAFVPEEELSTEESIEESVNETESTETVTETQEPAADEAVIDAKTVSEDKTAGAGYTYSEVSKTMYAKSTVNVRSLPSTSGNRLGSLSKNQKVAVTGQCNETGWYKISYNNAEGFVSNKYLTDEPVAAAAGTKTAQAQVGTKTNSGTSTGDPVIDAAIAKYGPHIMVANDGTIYSSETFQLLGTLDGSVDNGSTTSNTTVTTKRNSHEDGYDRAIAEEIWGYMNAERTSAGLDAIAWNEDIYNFSCTRAQQIVTDFSHSGSGGYGENILLRNSSQDAYDMHMQWHDSYGHHYNYMTDFWTDGACAVYFQNGTAYAVQNFDKKMYESSGKQTREYNGQTIELTDQEAEAFDNGKFWIASNGVFICIRDDGTVATYGNSHTQDEVSAAVAEYFATH